MNDTAIDIPGISNTNRASKLMDEMGLGKSGRSVVRQGTPSLKEEVEDDRSDRSSGEQDDRADKMLSREEFAQCFRGVPKFSEELVDDFLYLFELNSEGQIEFEEFVKVVKELKVLVHEAEK